jgi:hypothetical protein
MAFVIRQHFESLADCLRFLASAYPQAAIQLSSKDIGSGEVFESEAPKYLFRGEPAAYDTTVSSMERMKNCPHLSVSSKQELEKLSQWVNSELQKKADLQPMLSAGFCQHYGLPSELIDFTADLEVAGVFASLGELRPIGMFVVLEVREVSKQSMLIDLREHPFGLRPRRQSAVGFFHRRFIDLKSNDCTLALRSHWYSFSRSELDIDRFADRLHGENALLDAHRDPIAGYMQLCIDDYVRAIGKIQDASAIWLSDRIAPAPLMGRLTDRYPNESPRILDVVPAEAAGIPYDEKKERNANRRRWSASFPDYRPSSFS